MSIDPQAWARTFVADLSVAGENIPLERAVARHLASFDELRAKLGMTWRGIASMLTRAGARRSDGGLISADQLRVSHARLCRKSTLTGGKPRNRSQRPAQRSEATPSESIRASTRPDQEPRVVRETLSIQPEDVLDFEMDAALQRLRKLGPK